MMGYSMNFSLFNKYFEIIIRCLELEIFIEKYEVLFEKMKKKLEKNVNLFIEYLKFQTLYDHFKIFCK